MYSKMQCDSPQTGNSSLTGFQQDSVWRKHCLKAQRMAVKESTKYWENLRNFLLSSMSPCSRPLLACLLPTGLLSIWQVSFQTDLPSKKIYYFVDYCTALFSSPVIVVKVLKVTTSKQSICHCLISNWEGLGMSLCIMGYLKIWFSGGGLSSKFLRSEFFWHSNLMWSSYIVFFTITEQFLAHWLVKSYGL